MFCTDWPLGSHNRERTIRSVSFLLMKTPLLCFFASLLLTSPALAQRPVSLFPDMVPVRTPDDLRKVLLPNTTLTSIVVNEAEGSVRITAVVTHPPATDRVTVWVALPLKNWNGRFMGNGGGGFNGGGGRYDNGGNNGGNRGGWNNGWGEGGGWNNNGDFNFNGGRRGSGSYRDRNGNNRRLDQARVMVHGNGGLTVEFQTESGRILFTGSIERRQGRRERLP